MIKQTIKERTNKALKEKDEILLRTMRLLSTAIHNAEIDKKDTLTEEETIKIIQKEAKKRKDAIDIYKNAGDERRVKEETEELSYLSEFLPKQMSEEEISTIVSDVISQTGAKSQSDIGMVMGPVMGKVSGKADGSLVSRIVKEKLS